jgi:hypothetical protein
VIGKDREATVPLEATVSLTLAPLHPRLDRPPAPAPDHWGPAGALDANPRLRPLDRAVPGPPSALTGEAGLECLSQVETLRSGIVDSMVATRVGTILKITRTSPSWWNGYLSTPR